MKILMNKGIQLLVSLMLSVFYFSQPVLAQATSFSETQKSEIESVIHQYLINHPEVIKEAFQALQSQENKILAQRAQGAIVEHQDQIFNHDSPKQAAKDKADVTLVEFFDYQCPHCKRLEPMLDNLVAKNKGLQIIYKELPILGPNSVMAAQAALAAQKQDKYLDFHHALMTSDQELNEKKIMDIAQKVGLDLDKLRKDMSSTEVTDEIKANYAIAQAIGLRGTPTFIVTSAPFNKDKAAGFEWGETSEATLQSLINNAKSK